MTTTENYTRKGKPSFMAVERPLTGYQLAWGISKDLKWEETWVRSVRKPLEQLSVVQ